MAEWRNSVWYFSAQIANASLGGPRRHPTWGDCIHRSVNRQPPNLSSFVLSIDGQFLSHGMDRVRPFLLHPVRWWKELARRQRQLSWNGRPLSHHRQRWRKRVCCRGACSSVPNCVDWAAPKRGWSEEVQLAWWSRGCLRKLGCKWTQRTLRQWWRLRLYSIRRRLLPLASERL